ncbi:hypothetical protein DSL72_000572 [Monilinia vaccinii-corymbosi]|uniref:Fungal N-terminal domain-containing protein n=1 Tax=Monilinia vaccinii-corymbosi TaxID=61207 RepID=A0A8A3P6J7_9HELO|nr:hypothetical protein DSL72_000572 [Monilinia vaccinii-corymbosi]
MCLDPIHTSYSIALQGIERHTEGLHAVLQHLKSLLQKISCDGGSIPSSVALTINNCHTSLQVLEHALRKHGKGTLRKRLTYPFFRDDLNDVAKSLDGLQDNLNLAVQALTLESCHHHISMTSNLTKYATNNFEGILVRFNTLESQMKMNHQPTRQPSLMAEQCSRFEAIRDDVYFSRRQQISNSTAPPYIWPKSFSAFWNHSSSHRITCPYYHLAQQVKAIGASYMLCSKLLRFSLQATISLTQGAGGFSISPQLKFISVVPNDSPSFKLFDFRSDRNSYPDGILSVEAIMHVKLIGLFELYHDGKASAKDVTPEGETIIEAAMSWISHVVGMLHPPYKRHRCHPEFWTDFSPHAKILRHLVYSCISVGVSLDIGKKAHTSFEQVLRILSDIPDKLVEVKKEFFDIQEMILDAGYGIDFKSKFYYSGEFSTLMPFKEYQQQMEHFLEATHRVDALNSPEIIELILTRSEAQLRRLLDRCPNVANLTLFDHGETPLHIAHAWPQGLLILLKAGANVNQCDKVGILPIFLAVRANCLDSVRVLIAHGSPLHSENQNQFLILDRLKVNCRIYLRSIFIFIPDAVIRSELFSAVVDRRQRILRRALSIHVPPWFHDWLKTDRMPDLQLAEISRIINSNVPPTDPMFTPVLSPYSNTVYHNRDLTPESAEILWQAGFRDIDGYATIHGGYTPFMSFYMRIPDILFPLHIFMPHHVKILQWFVEKGLDLSLPLFENKQTVSHTVGTKMAAMAKMDHFGPLLVAFKGSEDCAEKIKECLADNFTDDCLCACSLSGCLPITRASTVLYLDAWSERNLKRSSVLAEFLEPSFAKFPHLSHNILRVMTFDRLGLTHTCCRGRREFQPGEKDDFPEIREEQVCLIDQLEHLMEEFVAEYENSHDSLSVFIEGYWRDRMEQEMEGRELNEEELENIREIGVIME